MLGSKRLVLRDYSAVCVCFVGMVTDFLPVLRTAGEHVWLHCSTCLWLYFTALHVLSLVATPSHAPSYTHTCTCTHEHTHMCTCAHTHIHTHPHTHTYTHVHTHHMHMHTHAHTHTHTHTHTIIIWLCCTLDRNWQCIRNRRGAGSSLCTQNIG